MSPLEAYDRMKVRERPAAAHAPSQLPLAGSWEHRCPSVESLLLAGAMSPWSLAEQSRARSLR